VYRKTALGNFSFQGAISIALLGNLGIFLHFHPEPSAVETASGKSFQIPA
jgi:hypothetical protein